MPGEVRAAQVAEVADGLEHGVEACVAQRRSLDRLGVEDLTGGVVVDTGKQRTGIALHGRGDLGIEVRALPRPNHLHCTFEAGRALEDLAGLSHVRDPRGQRQCVAPDAGRHPLAVPSGVGLLDPGSNFRAQPQAISEFTRRRAVVGHLLDHRPSTRTDDRRHLPRPIHRGRPGAGPAHQEERGGHTGQVHLDGPRAKVDVVPEQGSCFVAVDRATDIRQQADVVQRGQLLLGQAQPPADPHADPGRANHVLRRLPQPEIGSRGQGHQYFAQPHPGVGHGADRTTLTTAWTVATGVNAS